MRKVRLFEDLIHTMSDHGMVEEAQMYESGFISLTVRDTQDKTLEFTVSVIPKKGGTENGEHEG